MTPIQKSALATSLILTSTLGGAFVYLYWSVEGAVTLGIGRSIGFVAIMACIHAIGYLLYQQQSLAGVSGVAVFSIPTPISSSRIADVYRDAIKAAVVQPT